MAGYRGKFELPVKKTSDVLLPSRWFRLRGLALNSKTVFNDALKDIEIEIVNAKITRDGFLACELLGTSNSSTILTQLRNIEGIDRPFVRCFRMSEADFNSTIDIGVMVSQIFILTF